MDLVTILAAAAEHEEHSEALFFAVGGAFAAFAVIIGAVGVARPNWGGPAMNVVMGIGALLTVGTMVSILVVSS